MTTINTHTLQQLSALNKWLKDVFGEGTRLSVLLSEEGFSDEDNATIKSRHLAVFIEEVVDLIANDTTVHDWVRRNSVIVHRYGLCDGTPETLQSIGDSFDVSRERIRQLVQKQIRISRNAKRKEQFKADIASIARRILDADTDHMP